MYFVCGDFNRPASLYVFCVATLHFNIITLWSVLSLKINWKSSQLFLTDKPISINWPMEVPPLLLSWFNFPAWKMHWLSTITFCQGKWRMLWVYSYKINSINVFEFIRDALQFQPEKYFSRKWSKHMKKVYDRWLEMSKGLGFDIHNWLNKIQDKNNTIQSRIIDTKATLLLTIVFIYFFR